MNKLQNNNIIIARYLLKGWYLSAIEINRYPGCTTRTSVPSQPTLQKAKKRIKLVKRKNTFNLTLILAKTKTSTKESSTKKS